ncbi:MAG TPA: major capsid protein [Acetobacteraceae bacterium]
MSGALYAAPGTIPQFSVIELTRSLNEVAPVPGLIGSLNLFAAQPQSTTIATIERRRDRLALVPEQPRGAPANRNVMGERYLLQMKVPHFPLGDTIMADSIQDVRAFGQSSGLEGWGHAVNRRLEVMGHHLDATLEHLRLGAVKGLIITVTDRETGAPLRSIDLFAHFGVVPQETTDLPMRGPGAQSMDAAWNGRIMAASRLVGRTIAAEIGGASPGIAAVCGSLFFDMLLASAELRQTYLATAQAPTLRESRLFTPVSYAGIDFFNAGMEGVGGMAFVAPDEAYFVPLGVPDLFVEAYAPADYVESVNTVALPRYAKQEMLDFGKGIEIETQTNVLPLCTKPRALLTGRLTDATP